MAISAEQRMVAVVRDCPARAVPSGTPMTIPKNTFVTITQARGGNYTISHRGNLARVDGTDADAIGQAIVELMADPALRAACGETLRKRVEMYFTSEISAGRYAALYQELVA